MTKKTGLYIHIPWCIKKCPYCDFNSHKSPAVRPEMDYVQQLVKDFEHDVTLYPKDKIDSIFIGGGTPSLFSAQAYALLFEQLQNILPWNKNIEITLEANPGTVDNHHFQDYRAIGINRLSIGVQSFQDRFLKTCGRIHDAKKAHEAIEKAHQAGFASFNIDLMYGLPNQTCDDALLDLKTAIEAAPKHLSWYELTIEPNTLFYKNPPTQPKEDVFIDMEIKGRELLQNHGYKRYEVSAYAKANAFCQHNLNYWQYGDYYGIGAGAHSKLTQKSGVIIRLAKHRMPNRYLQTKHFIAETKIIELPQDIMFEYMLNACRLIQAHLFSDFEEQTNLPISALQSYLLKASKQGLIDLQDESWQISSKGLQFNNEIIQLFL